MATQRPLSVQSVQGQMKNKRFVLVGQFSVQLREAWLNWLETAACNAFKVEISQTGFKRTVSYVNCTLGTSEARHCSMLLHGYQQLINYRVIFKNFIG